MASETTTHSLDESPLTEPEKEVHRKWGAAVSKDRYTGFVLVPEALIRGQRDLGIRSTEMVVLLNVLMHWWDADRNPYPSNEAIAGRMGVETRTVQRAMRTLQQQGLIKRDVKRAHVKETGAFISTREISLDGLVRKTKAIAVNLREWAKAKEAKEALE